MSVFTLFQYVGRSANALAARLHKNTCEEKGTNLTDANATIYVTGSRWRVMPAATLSASRTITLGTTGAALNDQICITRLDATANTMPIVNGGAGAGTLVTLPASKVNFVVCQFDGTNWALRQVGTQ